MVEPSSEQSNRVERGYSAYQRRVEARRKLALRGVKAAVGTAVLLGSLFGIGKAMELASEQKDPDTYYTGKIEVVMSDNLNVRKEPIVIINAGDKPNDVDWSQVMEVNGKKIEGGKSFVIENPLITYGDDPDSGEAGKGPWVTFDAKLNKEDEKLYVSLSSTTSAYVKPVESGTFVKLNPLLTPENLGNVTVNP